MATMTKMVNNGEFTSATAVALVNVNNGNDDNNGKQC